MRCNGFADTWHAQCRVFQGGRCVSARNCRSPPSFPFTPPRQPREVCVVLVRVWACRCKAHVASEQLTGHVQQTLSQASARAYTHTLAHSHARTRAYTLVYVQTHAHTRTRTHLRINAHTHIREHTRAHAHAHVPANTRIHARARCAQVTTVEDLDHVWQQDFDHTLTRILRVFSATVRAIPPATAPASYARPRARAHARTHTWVGAREWQVPMTFGSVLVLAHVKWFSSPPGMLPPAGCPPAALSLAPAQGDCNSGRVPFRAGEHLAVQHLAV